MNSRNEKIGIVILNWNGSKDTIECIESLNIFSDIYDIYVADNNSEKDDVENIIVYFNRLNNKVTVSIIDEISEIKNSYAKLNLIKLDKNYGFANANNIVANELVNKYDNILLLNNDTVVENNAIENMLKVFEKTDYIASTCVIYNYYDKTLLWNAGGNITFYGDRKYHNQKKIEKYRKNKIECIESSFITGCVLMVKTSYIKKSGLFTNNFFHGEEDFNFCLNARINKAKLCTVINSTVYHKVGTSIGKMTNNINKIVLHYANRIIDIKSFINRRKWKIWRCAYLILIELNLLIKNTKIKDVLYIKRRLLNITNEYDKILYTTYMKIINGEEI